LAFKILGLATRVVGISVQQTGEKMVPLIVERARQAAEMLGLQTTVGPDDFDFIDDFRGPEYGVPSQAGVEAMQLAGRTEGLLLDPVYSGKALAGLLHHERHHGEPSGKPIVFVHTGGTPGIFANAALIAPWLTT
jgi:1-aminocyclopropane-1-carboxylate deaminase/D-cysteine desulfhydrase-like pyridoxal-dependent ACC family enzyme